MFITTTYVCLLQCFLPIHIIALVYERWKKKTDSDENNKQKMLAKILKRSNIDYGNAPIIIRWNDENITHIIIFFFCHRDISHQHSHKLFLSFVYFVNNTNKKNEQRKMREMKNMYSSKSLQTIEISFARCKKKKNVWNVKFFRVKLFFSAILIEKKKTTKWKEETTNYYTRNNKWRWDCICYAAFICIFL